MELGIDLLHVPYKGTVPAIADVIAGNVSMALANTLVALPQVRTGRVRGIAITKRQTQRDRARASNDRRIRLPGFDAGTWYGLLASADTPREIVTRLNREVVRIVQLADIREKLAAQGAEPLTSTPEKFGAFVRGEVARWAKVVKAARTPAGLITVRARLSS